MQSPIANSLVSTDWLEAHLMDDNLVLLDASMVSVIGKEPILYDEVVCIPRSRRFDLENVFCDSTSSQVHALPTQDQFITGMARLGIEPHHHIVIYDNQGIYAAPRAWWLCKLMGLDTVYVLDGGLPQWLEEDRLTSSRYQSEGVDYGQVDEQHYNGLQYQPELVIDAQNLLLSLGQSDIAILDARGSARFLGQVAEPRAGVRGGHIPHAVNLPFAQVLSGHKLKRVTELQALFSQKAPSESTRIFSCGSGITACILILASVVAGHQQAKLYDGSWAEWGSRADLPVET